MVYDMVSPFTKPAETCPLTKSRPKNCRLNSQPHLQSNIGTPQDFHHAPNSEPSRGDARDIALAGHISVLVQLILIEESELILSQSRYGLGPTM